MHNAKALAPTTGVGAFVFLDSRRADGTFSGPIGLGMEEAHMGTKTFDKEDLISLVDGDDVQGLQVMENTITGTGRWSIHHRLVFKELDTGKFWAVGYSRGATEQQDESPFENGGARVTCREVLPVEKMVTVYERTPAEGSSSS
jgi:hypothetical protein